MAGETKVGLLAGLAFIICFAIILANRGRHEPARAQMPYRVDSGGGLQHATEVSSARPTHAQPPQRPNTGFPSSAESDDAGAVQVTRRQDPVRVGRDTRDDAASSVPTAGSEVVLRAQVDAPSDSRSPRRSTETARARQVPESSTVESPSPVVVRGAGSDRTSTDTSPRPSSPSPSVPGSTRYTVVQGDTLSKIAAAHYGSKSATVITAIFEANRLVLSSPDVLSVGAELTLPDVNGFTLKTRSDSATQARSASAALRGEFRWYQIKKNDRYTSIAREQLGDAKRWREIHELNKGVFSDPDLIRDGVLIKLPRRSVGLAARSARGQAARPGKNGAQP